MPTPRRVVTIWNAVTTMPLGTIIYDNTEDFCDNEYGSFAY